MKLIEALSMWFQQSSSVVYIIRFITISIKSLTFLWVNRQPLLNRCCRVWRRMMDLILKQTKIVFIKILFPYRVKLDQGGTLVMVIVFGAVFIGLIIILVSQVVSENKQINRTIDKTVALQIAEAGLEKMRWHLAHNPQDYDGPNDVALNGDNEYVWTEDYYDPISGELLGELQYTTQPESFCNITNNASIKITATSAETGETYSLQQFHTKESAANYSYIYNQTTRAGDDRLIRGRYHSNGRVRMDGQNDSVVSSSLKNGVYGSPPHPDARTDLWQDEVGTIDFNGLAVDLISIRDKADTTISGDSDGVSPAGEDNLNDLLFTPRQECRQVEYCRNKNKCWYYTDCSISAQAFEVELVNDDNTDEASIKVWELNDLPSIRRSNDTNEQEKYCGTGSSVDFSDYDDADHDFEDVPTCEDGRTSYLGEFTLNNNCPVAFFEAPVFLYGNLDAKALIASGDLETTDAPGVYLFNNLYYESNDGSDGLTVVSEGDVKLAYSIPDDMQIQGIFIAQSGRYGRDNYTEQKFKKRDFLQTIGSVVSDEGGGTKWATPSEVVSGFIDRENYYDRNLSRRPPPMTPSVGSNYTYVEWRDQEISR